MIVIIGNLSYRVNCFKQTSLTIENIEENNNVQIDIIKSQVLLIKNVAQKMAKIISSMRKLSGDEKTEPHEKINVVELIKDALLLCEGRMAKCSIHFELITEFQENAYITCSQTQINQVIINVLNNAIDAVKDKELKHIIIRLEKKNNLVQIIIEDSGGGIPPNIAKRIFEPKFTTKSLAQGTGLGLAISKKIIEQNHGGTLTLDNSKKGSTIFVITLPIGEN